MKALLLAAGFGTRLRPLTDTVPKCLVPIGGRPLLEYWFHGLFAAGVESIFINLHYLPETVRSCVAASPFASRITLFHEEALLGTAGTLTAAADWLGGSRFFLAHADNLCVTDFRTFLSAHEHRPAEAALTMMTFDPPDPRQCGVVVLGDRGLVREFHEKVPEPPSRLANAAVYIMEPEVVTTARALLISEPDISRHLLPAFIGRMATWHNADYHLDIGTPETYASACTAIAGLRPLMRRFNWFPADQMDGQLAHA